MTTLPVGGALDEIGAQLAAIQAAIPSTVVGIATDDSAGGIVHVDIGGGEIRECSDPSRAIAKGSRLYVTLTSVPRAVPADPLGAVPVSACMIWLGTTAPLGWAILRSGASFDSAAHPRLFALLGTTSLPYPDDRYLIGASASRAVKSTGGSEFIGAAQLPPHSHTYGSSEYSDLAADGAVHGTAINAGSYTTGETGDGEAYWPRYYAVNLIMYLG